MSPAMPEGVEQAAKAGRGTSAARATNPRTRQRKRKKRTDFTSEARRSFPLQTCGIIVKKAVQPLARRKAENWIGIETRQRAERGLDRFLAALHSFLSVGGAQGGVQPGAVFGIAVEELQPFT